MNNLTVEITITQQCDMACTYCFEGEELQNKNKQTNEEAIIKGIQSMLVSEDFNSTFSGIEINFWGGEASLNFKMCNRIITTFKDNKNVFFFFYTNGLNGLNLINIIENYKKEINDDFKRLSFQISYDGKYNDITRVDHTGKGTAERILGTLDHLFNLYPTLIIRLKSTILPEQLKDMSTIWEEFKDIREKYGRDLSYSPTIEYTQNYNISEDDLQLIRKEFLKIGKKEIEYYKEHGSYILSWFYITTRSLCSAGSNIINIDLNGDILVCHGALYSENKDDLKFGNINDVDFISSFLKNRYKYTKGLLDTESGDILKEQYNHCKECSATVCYQCPTVNYDRNIDKDLSDIEKYHTNKFDMCSVLNAFGKISQSIQQVTNGYQKEK